MIRGVQRSVREVNDWYNKQWSQFTKKMLLFFGKHPDGELKTGFEV